MREMTMINSCIWGIMCPRIITTMNLKNKTTAFYFDSIDPSLKTNQSDIIPSNRCQFAAILTKQCSVTIESHRHSSSK